MYRHDCCRSHAHLPHTSPALLLALLLLLLRSVRHPRNTAHGRFAKLMGSFHREKLTQPWITNQCYALHIGPNAHDRNQADRRHKWVGQTRNHGYRSRHAHLNLESVFVRWTGRAKLAVAQLNLHSVSYCRRTRICAICRNAAIHSCGPRS